jgi:hypothetical protein
MTNDQGGVTARERVLHSVDDSAIPAKNVEMIRKLIRWRVQKLNWQLRKDESL